MLKTQRAKNLFDNNRYREALDLYTQLAKEVGTDAFKLNIDICRKRVLETDTKNAEEGNNSIDIVYICDEKYALGTFVSISSLKNNRSTNVRYCVYVLGDQLSVRSKVSLEQMSCPGFSVRVYDSTYDLSGFVMKKKGFHVSTAAILKFSIADIFDHLDKVLYLDGDTIIKSDLLSLFFTDVSDKYAAVVEDIKPKLVYKPSILTKLSIESHEAYFNSGVMLLNLKKIREDNVIDKLFSYRRNGLNFFMDQDALNVVFSGKVNYLPLKYNFLTTLQEIFSIEEVNMNYLEASYASYDDVATKAEVVHFASKNKPWSGHRNDFTAYWMSEYVRSYTENALPILHPVQYSFSPSDLVVSLTSYPARIGTVHITIESILNQVFRPSLVVLWLAEEQFPNKERDLPDQLLRYVGQGLLIGWCHDIRSYKKLIPSLGLFSNKVVVTADDDIIYNEHWLGNLVASYLQEPDAIHCCRAHHIAFDSDGEVLPYRRWKRDVKDRASSYKNFFTGCGGVLYPPRSLHSDVMNESSFTELCPYGDDIWFWGMAVLNGTKIKIVDQKFDLSFVPDSQDTALWRDNDKGGRNDVMLKAFFDRYPRLVGRVAGGDVPDGHDALTSYAANELGVEVSFRYTPKKKEDPELI